MWFRGEFVEAILSGRKRSTVRKAKRLPRVGQIVPLSRGARPAFAYAAITSVKALTGLSPQKAAELMRCYPGQTLEDLRVVRFRIVSIGSM